MNSAHKCHDCGQAVHFICRDPVPNSEEGYGQPVICFKCKEKQKIAIATPSLILASHGELFTYQSVENYLKVYFIVHTRAFSCLSKFK